MATTQVTEKEARKVAEAARETEWRKPSFGKGLFLGNLDLDLIHPHPEPDPAEVSRGEDYLKRVRHFLETEVDGAVIEREARIPDQVLKGMAKLGLFAMKVPQEYGGLGLSQLYFNKVLILVNSVNAAIGTMLSAHQSIGAPQPVKMFGTPEQKQRVMPRFADGSISAFLLTEADCGSDPARMASTAVPTEDGTAYILNGVKLWTTNGVVADILVVMAVVPKSEGHRGGISAFIVEADSEGITVENRNAFMGLRGIENGVTRFHNVLVPAENLLDREGAGLKIALTTLNTGRLSLPAACAGAGKWATKIAREWSAARTQWGKPIYQHEAVGKKIAFIAATSFAIEAVTDLSSIMADEDRNDIRIEAALAKLFASEKASELADELVQVRGGRGFETAPSLQGRGERAVAAEQLVRDLRINRIFEGSTEIMRLIIAREAVDAHLSVAGDIVDPDTDRATKARALKKATGFYASWLPKLLVGAGTNPRSFEEFGSLAGHLRFAERGSRKLARSTFYGMSRWQGKLEYRQVFLGRIVDIGAELFAICASVVRAEQIRARDAVQGAAAYELADAFARQSRLRVEDLFRGLWENTDDTDRAFVEKVIAGRYSWQEDGIIDPSDDGSPWISEWSPGPTATTENLHRKIF
ncbi:MAG: acyl-CoA dehydrogenase family protein [Sporichthyaceae bacterium]